MGFSEETLDEFPGRHYIKRLNMQYVDTNRDLFSFLKRERNQMLTLAKDKRTPEIEQEDDEKTTEIQNDLDTINTKISSLHYVSTALEQVNKELSDLSIHNTDQSVQFIAGESNAEKLLDELVLAYSSEENPLAIGGDGRNNQIWGYLTTLVMETMSCWNIGHKIAEPLTALKQTVEERTHPHHD